MSNIPACLVVFLVTLVGLSPGAPFVSAQDATPLASPAACPASVEVVARGLTNPRGFRWEADGTLLVAEAGSAGSTAGAVNGTPTPFVGGATAAIVAIRDGQPVPVVANLPSAEMTPSGWISGAADLATLNGQLYLLDGSGGAIHGNPDQPSGVYRVGADGTVALVADLVAWVDAIRSLTRRRKARRTAARSSRWKPGRARSGSPTPSTARFCASRPMER